MQRRDTRLLLLYGRNFRFVSVLRYTDFWLKHFLTPKSSELVTSFFLQVLISGYLYHGSVRPVALSAYSFFFWGGGRLVYRAPQVKTLVLKIWYTSIIPWRGSAVDEHNGN